MKCKKCGTANIDDARYCSNCGEKLFDEFFIDFDKWIKSWKDAKERYELENSKNTDDLKKELDNYIERFDNGDYNCFDNIATIAKVLEERGIKHKRISKGFITDAGEKKYMISCFDKNENKEKTFGLLTEINFNNEINKLKEQGKIEDLKKIYNLSEEYNYPYGMMQYAMDIYNENFGLEKDLEKVYVLARKSADLENYDGKRLLSIMYLNGIYVKQDFELYEKLALEGINVGDRFAKRLYGISLIDGTIGKVDKALGEKLLIECVNNYKDGLAANQLGYYYMNGIIGECKDYAKAKQAFEIAIQYGDPNAQGNLQIVEEQLSLNKDMKKHLFWRK